MIGLALSAALAAVPASAEYPVTSVWRSFVSFCASSAVSRLGWVEFKPVAETTLAYLAADPMRSFTGVEGPSAKVYRKVVVGRSLFAFKRRIGNNPDRVEFCQLYDFQAPRLNRAKWSRAVGTLTQSDEREFTQKFGFGTVNGLRNRGGSIVLHQKGYFPLLDTVGFLGLELTSVSKVNR